MAAWDETGNLKYPCHLHSGDLEAPSKGQLMDSEANQNTPFHEKHMLCNHLSMMQTKDKNHGMQQHEYLWNGSLKFCKDLLKDPYQTSTLCPPCSQQVDYPLQDVLPWTKPHADLSQAF